MEEPTQPSEQIITHPDPRPLMFSSKLTLAFIIALCGWFIFGLNTHRKVVLPENDELSLYRRSIKVENESGSQVIKIDGFRFFKEPVRISLADRKRLISLLEDRKLYVPPSRLKTSRPMIKKCGGFSPNYALVWGNNRILICFGCGEIRHYQGDHLDEYDLVFAYRIALMNFLASLFHHDVVQYSCSVSDECIADGHCTMLNGRCAVASAQDCVEVCKTSGRCSASLAWGTCLVNRHQDCQQSKICQENGRCSRARGDRGYYECKKDEPISEIIMEEYFDYFVKKIDYLKYKIKRYSN